MTSTQKKPDLEIVSQVEPDQQSTLSLTTLSDWITEIDEQSSTELEVVRIGTEPTYLSLFTDQGAPTSLHYLEATESWSRGGYYHCLDDECPACRAHIEQKKFMLMPVMDLEEAKVKVLRIPSEKGPGKLQTEISKILALPEKANTIVKVTRGRNYVYTVEISPGDAFQPDVAAAIKYFQTNVESGLIDIASSALRVSAQEMLNHERVAKRLRFEGNGSGQ